jgi:pyruvate/2-oxoglutarate dehydrogenase complex dihydrolipoamide dehydrogenase (E3) component
MSRPSRYDLAIVGGGTAGLVAAFVAAALGARVCLVERVATGGDCLWTGCVPSKSLIAAASRAQDMRRASAVGLEPVEPAVDFARVMAHVRGAREHIAPHDSPERLRASGVEVIEGDARFAGPGRLAVAGRTLAYRTALVATGSSPLVPPVSGIDAARPLTTDTVWELDELPRRLLVLGGGTVGCELGQAYARLGAEVTLVEPREALLGGEEPEAKALVERRLREEGVDVRLGSEPVRVEAAAGDGSSGAGRATLQRTGGGSEREALVEFDRVLVATGRRPDTAELGLDTVGVETDASGAVVVDDRLRTTAAGVFAAGDVTGALPFTHVADYHAKIAVANALFRTRRRVSYAAVPRVTFTDPEVARVGITEAEARKRFGERAVVRVAELSHLDRGICAGEEEGFAKLVGDPRGRLIGATVVAPGAGEAIAEHVAWIDRGAKIDALSNIVHAYPTFAELSSRAADDHMMAKLLDGRVRALSRSALAALRLVDRAGRRARA